MNLYLKYGPLLYTWNTRIVRNGRISCCMKDVFFNLVAYIYTNMGVGMLGIIYLYIVNIISFNSFIISFFLLFGLYLLFLNFYEIGYLHNSIVAKKEKNPTIRIYENLPKSFYLVQFILRFIFGIVGIIILFYLYREMIFLFIGLILITQIVFFIHNILRNRFYNVITIILLRIFKFSIIFFVLNYLLGSISNLYGTYLSILFLFYLLFDIIFGYNGKIGGVNKVSVNSLYIFLFISCIFFSFYTFNSIFLFFGCIYFILFICTTPKAMFSIKNDR